MPELLTTEQMLEELYARATPIVAEAVRKGMEIYGETRMPEMAIKKDLRLVRVTAWMRLPEDQKS